MKIQVLGSGCPTCRQLHQSVKEVVQHLKIDSDIEYSSDIAKIIEVGAMSSPVLVIDGVLVASGRSPSSQEIEKFITCSMSDAPCCADKTTCIGCDLSHDQPQDGCFCGGIC